jgi:hypothetical protein
VKGSFVKRIKHPDGEVDNMHPACADRYYAALADPPVTVPDLGPDPYDEHGAPRAQTSCAPSTPSLGQDGEAQGAIRVCAQCSAGSLSDPPTIEVSGKNGKRSTIGGGGPIILT